MAIKLQDIMDAVVARLAEIDGTGDYVTDFEGRVEDSRLRWDLTEVENGISVFELPTEVPEAPDSHRRTIRLTTVAIRIFLKADSDAATNAANYRQAMADVTRAILGTGTGSDGYLAERFPDTDGKGLVMDSTLKRFGPEYDAESMETQAAIVEIDLKWIADKWSI